MNLASDFLGIKLRTPLVVSASPLSAETDNLRRMEDAGASAVVLDSFFAEQLEIERANLFHSLVEGTNSFAEAQSFFPDLDFQSGSTAYLEKIRRAKAAVSIPVIASLNGTHPGQWTRAAREMAQAGADALELNIYDIPTDMDRTAIAVEQGYLDIVTGVRAETRIPLTVKIGPQFSSLGNFARGLIQSGANGLTLFNRFYQPDFDIEALEVKPHIILSTPQAMRLPMRWIAILYGRLPATLSASGGIHEAQDVVKMIMAGADVAMLCSVLLKHGIPRIRKIEEGLIELMERLEYDSLDQMRGCLSHEKCEDPSIYERALYIKGLKNYRPQV